MEFPKECPVCEKSFDGEAYLVQRASPLIGIQTIQTELKIQFQNVVTAIPYSG
jgi:hypothetical protein